MLGVPWEQCDVVFGSTAKNLPWTCVSAGSQTAHAMTRAAHAAATDAIKKLQEIAAKARGGNPDAYKVANGRVSGPGGSMTFAQAAEKAIELGGKFDGHELPGRHQRLHEDVGDGARRPGPDGRGQGRVSARRAIRSPTSSASRKSRWTSRPAPYHVENYTAIGDVGIVLNPRSLDGQLFGGSMLGLGHALSQKWAYDQQYGVALARRFHHNKPPTILDAPKNFSWDAVDLPDPETPTGIRGVGEPPVGAAYGAIMNAILDALGDEAFRRSPVTPDMLLMAIENGGNRTHEPLTFHI